MGRYHRQPLRGFRKFAMVFWDAPKDGSIYGHMEVDCTKALRFLEDCKAKHGIAPSMGQLVGKGVALAAANKVPEINGKIIWGRHYLKDTVDIYFQVDVEDGKDLSGVVVPDTAKKSLVEVATILRDKSKKLRGGQDKQYEKTQKGCLGWVPVSVLRPLMSALTFIEYNLGLPLTPLGAQPEPFGTLMVSNVSKFGIDVAYAPTVPVSRVPFVCLVGQVKSSPWVDPYTNQLCVRPTMTVSGTFDHRMLDGNKIGKFIKAVRTYIEEPYAHEPALGLVDPLPPTNPPRPDEKVADKAPAQAAAPGPAPTNGPAPAPEATPTGGTAVPRFK